MAAVLAVTQVSLPNSHSPSPVNCRGTSLPPGSRLDLSFESGNILAFGVDGGQVILVDESKGDVKWAVQLHSETENSKSALGRIERGTRSPMPAPHLKQFWTSSGKYSCQPPYGPGIVLDRCLEHRVTQNITSSIQQKCCGKSCEELI